MAETNGEDLLHGAIVDWAIYRDGRRQRDVATLADALDSALDRDDSFLWLGLFEPSYEQLSAIAEQFGLHDLAIEDAVHAHQRPKLEEYDDSVFAVIKTVRYVDHVEVFEIGEIMVFLGRSFVITVRHGKGSALADVRRMLEAQPDILTFGASTVLWAVIDCAVDAYAKALAGAAEDIEEIEDAVFDTSITSPTERIYKLKRELLEFRRALDPLPDALAPYVSGEHEVIDQRLTKYLRDVQDHALRDGSRLANYDELLSDVLQANVALASLRQNEDMRKITAWAAILTVITAIAGIYGMNFENMPELQWHLGYYLCLGLIACISSGLYVTFRRNKWL